MEKQTVAGSATGKNFNVGTLAMTGIAFALILQALAIAPARGDDAQGTSHWISLNDTDTGPNISFVHSFPWPMDPVSSENATTVTISCGSNPVFRLSDLLASPQKGKLTFFWNRAGSDLTIVFKVDYLARLDADRITVTIDDSALLADKRMSINGTVTSSANINKDLYRSPNSFVSFDGVLFGGMLAPLILVVGLFAAIEIGAQRMEKNAENIMGAKNGEDGEEGILETQLKFLNYTDGWLAARRVYIMVILSLLILLSFFASTMLYFVYVMLSRTPMGMAFFLVIVIIPWITSAAVTAFFYRARNENVWWNQRLLRLRRHYDSLVSEKK